MTDILPGVSNGIWHPLWEPMIVMGGKLYFGGSKYYNVHSLMVFDGVNPPLEVDTFPIKNGYRAPWSQTVFNNKLYYFAGTDSGWALCIYDGQAPPVIRKHTISHTHYYSSGYGLVVFKGKLYFSDSLGASGHELLCYDPVTDQISLVADILPGSFGSSPSGFVVAGSKLYFTAVDHSHGRELYSYDGVTVKRLTDIVPGQVSGTGGLLVHFKGAIYFSTPNGTSPGTVHNELSRWDTASQTVSLVHSFSSVYVTGIGTGFYPSAHNLFMTVRTQSSGYELWRYDGSTCAMVADLNPGTANGVEHATMLEYKGYVYFNGNNGKTGKELYRILEKPGNTGVQNVKWDAVLSVYPNPATNSLTLEITLLKAEALRVSLTDVSGREIHTTGLQSYSTGINKVQIPIASFPAGQYFFHISDRSTELFSSGSFVKR